MSQLRATALVLWMSASSCHESADTPRGGAAVLESRGPSARDERRILDVLADHLVLDRLHDRLDELWPLHHRHEKSLEDWLEKAEALADRHPHHLEVTNKLRESALPYDTADQERDYREHPSRLALERTRERWKLAKSNDSVDPSTLAHLQASVAALEVECRKRQTWRFEESTDDWLHRQLSQLLHKMEPFLSEDPRAGGLAEARWRVERIAKLKAHARDDAPAWASARRAGLTMEPRFGLVPIGRDPASRNWEFAVRLSGDLPKRLPDGVLHRTESMAIVLVLLPGGNAKTGATPPTDDLDAGPHVDPGALPNESPVHTVRLDPFLVGKYEMTQAQWQALTGDSPSEYGEIVAYDNVKHSLLHPVERVSWTECRDVLRKYGMEIPTEVQWEYAARAGTSSSWSTGPKKANLMGFANLADRTAAKYNASWAGVHDWPELDDGFCLHSPCGHFAPNAFGLHDMHGNVWEWCRDNHGSYELPARDGDGFREVFDAVHKAVRGGSYNMPASAARCANRGVDPADLRSNMVGIRPAASIR